MDRTEKIKNNKYEKDKLFYERKSYIKPNLEKAFFDIYKDEPLPLRQGKAFAYALEKEPLTFYPYDRIAGRVFQGVEGSIIPFVEAPDEKWNPYSVYKVANDIIDANPEKWKDFVDYYGVGTGIGHITWHWDLLLSKGILGFIEEIKEKYCNNETQDDKKLFYEGVIESLKGLERFVLNAEKQIESLIKTGFEENCGCSKEEISDNLEYMKKNVHAALYPSKDFQSAVQLFLLQHIAVMLENPCGGNGPGRLDRML